MAARRVRWTHQLARPEQIPDTTDWKVWLYLAGRGAGKTRTAAEWLAFQASRNSKTRWAIVAPTFGDARDTCAEGESGIVNILREYGTLKDYNRSIGEIFLHNGSRIKLFSAEEPERLRGPQHHGGWFDELAAFKYPDAWDQYQFGLRLGTNPQTIVTTTPKPIKLIKQLIATDTTIVKRGSTFDNAKNLAPSALAELKLRYENTRLGRQELYGEILDDVEGALWSRSMIEQARVTTAPNLIRVVVGVDPAVTNTDDSDRTGIVVAGISSDMQYYVLDDRSLKASPDAWARVAVNAYQDWKADKIAEYQRAGQTPTPGELQQAFMKTDLYKNLKNQYMEESANIRRQPIATGPVATETAPEGVKPTQAPVVGKAPPPKPTEQAAIEERRAALRAKHRTKD